jgi:transposase-like protein
MRVYLNIDVSEYWCPNEGCSDYGKKGKGNVVLKEEYGKKEQRLFRCKTCGHCFSETRGTIFFNLVTPKEEVLRTLAMISEKGSIRGAARATGHDKSAICRWLKIAGEHSKEVTEYFLNDLQLTRVQVDEIWSYIKKRRRT